MNKLSPINRKLFLSFLVFLYVYQGLAQPFYYEPDIAGAWTSSGANIATTNSNPSSGYTSSNQSPAASGAPGVAFRDCEHQNSLYTITSDAISTIGKSGIRVAFGRSEGSAFNESVLFQWSVNGTTWTTISSNVAAGGSAWNVFFFDLPSGANNQASLYFRFSFSPGNNGACSTNKTFFIDDFILGANFKLPIQLAYFEVKNEKNPRLVWSTLAELDNDYFSIQRSPDGFQYIELSKIKGAGSTDARKEYEFIDRNPLPGRNYYRLQQYDLDGASSFSPVRSIVRQLKGDYEVFPSLFQDRIRLFISPEVQSDTHWQVSDFSGKRIKSGRVPRGIEVVQLDLANLIPGAFILTLQSERTHILHKIIKLN